MHTVNPNTIQSHLYDSAKLHDAVTASLQHQEPNTAGMDSIVAGCEPGATLYEMRSSLSMLTYGLDSFIATHDERRKHAFTAVSGYLLVSQNVEHPDIATLAASSLDHAAAISRIGDRAIDTRLAIAELLRLPRYDNPPLLSVWWGISSLHLDAGIEKENAAAYAAAARGIAAKLA